MIYTINDTEYSYTIYLTVAVMQQFLGLVQRSTAVTASLGKWYDFLHFNREASMIKRFLCLTLTAMCEFVSEKCLEI
jgi:hypothetical protein